MGDYTRLTQCQKEAVQALAKHGFLLPRTTSAGYGYQPYAFHRRVLDALLQKELAEPDRQGGVRPVGWAERHAHAENDARNARALARRQRIGALIRDPALLADAVVSLEERISRISNHHHNVGGGVIRRSV